MSKETPIEELRRRYAEARQGGIRLKSIFGKISAKASEGRTLIEAPEGEVFVRAKGDDVRILALKGIGGDYDVRVEDGSLSILLPPEADAALSVITKNGTIRTSIPRSINRNWKASRLGAIGRTRIETPSGWRDGGRIRCANCA